MHDLVWLFAALLIALVPTVLVLGWLFAPRYRDLVSRLFMGFGVWRPLPFYQVPFAFALGTMCWMVIMLLVAGRAWAADAAPAAPVSLVSVDWTPIFNQVMELAAAALAGLIAVGIRRAVALLDGLHVLHTNQIHAGTIDSFADQLAQWVATQLEAIVDPQLKVQMKSSLLAKASQMLVDQAPLAIAATGLTPAGAKAAIEMKLDPPNPAVPAPAPPANN